MAVWKNLLILLFVLLLSSIPVNSNNTYKVIKIIDGDTFYIDFNNDGIAQRDEKIRLNGIDTFEVKPSVYLEWQMKEYGLTQDEALRLGYLAKEFAKKKLLNKYVRAEYTGETMRCDMGRHLMSIYYDKNKNYEKEVLKAGLSTVYGKSNLAPELRRYENFNKMRLNLKKSSNLNLVLLNRKNNKYHKASCPYAIMAIDVELIERPIDPKYIPSKCCYGKKRLFK